MFLVRSLYHATRSKSFELLSSVSSKFAPCTSQSFSLGSIKQYGTGYDPYAEYPTSSPFREKQPYHFGYKKKFYDGGENFTNNYNIICLI